MPFCCLISRTFPSKVQYHQPDTDQTQQNDAMLQAQVSSAPLLLFCSSNRAADCTKYFPGRQRCWNPHGQLESASHRGTPSTSFIYHSDYSKPDSRLTHALLLLPQPAEAWDLPEEFNQGATLRTHQHFLGFTSIQVASLHFHVKVLSTSAFVNILSLAVPYSAHPELLLAVFLKWLLVLSVMQQAHPNWYAMPEELLQAQTRQQNEFHQYNSIPAPNIHFSYAICTFLSREKV